MVTALDLFCGAGGASCGMYQSGVNLVAGVDNNKQALKTHKQNLPGRHIHHDLSDVDRTILPNTDIDWIHGSPPCQGFSVANSKRSEDDERNDLVWSFVDWVSEIGPTHVTMENVTGLMNVSERLVGELLDSFRDVGYKVRIETLNTADYGVPQSRKRVYLSANKSELDSFYPDKTHSGDGFQQTLAGTSLNEWTSVGDVLPDIRNQITDPPEQADVNKILDEPSKTIAATNPYLMTGKRKRDENGDTMATSISEKRITRLSVEQAARLQSFPGWFEFTGTKTEKYRQIGNAVPPLLQRKFATFIQEQHQ